MWAQWNTLSLIGVDYPGGALHCNAMMLSSLVMDTAMLAPLLYASLLLLR